MVCRRSMLHVEAAFTATGNKSRFHLGMGKVCRLAECFLCNHQSLMQLRTQHSILVAMLWQLVLLVLYTKLPGVLHPEHHRNWTGFPGNTGSKMKGINIRLGRVFCLLRSRTVVIIDPQWPHTPKSDDSFAWFPVMSGLYHWSPGLCSYQCFTCYGLVTNTFYEWWTFRRGFTQIFLWQTEEVCRGSSVDWKADNANLRVLIGLSIRPCGPLTTQRGWELTFWQQLSRVVRSEYGWSDR